MKITGAVLFLLTAIPAPALGLELKSDVLLTVVRERIQAVGTSSLRIDARYTDYVPPDKRVLSPQAGHFSFDSGMGKYEIKEHMRHEGGEIWQEKLFITNLDYAFRLYRYPDGSGYKLTRLSRARSEDDTAWKWGTERYGWFVPWAAGFYRIEDLVSGARSSVTRVEEVNRPSGKAVRIECRYTPEPTGLPARDSTRTIRFTTDPTAACRVLAWEMKIEEVGTFVGNVTYGGDEGGLPVPKSAGFTLTQNAGRVDTWRADFHEWRYRSSERPESDYRLSGYGLPEPRTLIGKRPWPVWIWLFSGGMVAWGLAIFFRRRARRS